MIRSLPAAARAQLAPGMQIAFRRASVARLLRALGAVFLLATASAAGAAETTILNVSYDVTRELYRDFDAAFARHWKRTTGATVTIRQSHGGSSKQARSVMDGLEADVVTMNQANDIDILWQRAQLVAPNWRERLPNSSVPYTSVTVFLVRKGNPHRIRDWNDLVAQGVAVIVPNPKTSGNGRYGYLSAWAYAVKGGADAAGARAFVTRLFRNVAVLDTGGRGATTTFLQRRIGDVLITFESEVALIRRELGGDQVDVVYPSLSILAENPVSVVDKVVDRRGTRRVAHAYLEYLYSEEGQTLAAKHGFRPSMESILARHRTSFPQLRTYTVQELFGGWDQAQKTHFDDGALFDQVYTAAR